ncbi:MAG: hypothetical protein IIZ00_05295 [Oscillospiraceae bacterium]|jgi:hypothetical protein|nr:hypothetical protein [Oscillospiraceae bacterium]MBQ4301823.1 hypothetical protein [Oscillospiraceae bacterium]MBQ5467606.1 hypothetical protein [Oscillospiraceae bacterium]
MAERSKARQVEYYDPDGNVQSGWYKDNRVYQDEAGTIPIPTGSTYQGDGGRYYRMTKYGDVLWSDPNRTDSDGHWIAQGNHWYQTAQDLMEKQLRRPGFSYDPTHDALYQGMKNEFVRQGKRAMSDAMGRASAMSGGYASSYAESLGHQAYAEQLGKLSEMIPELYDRARKDYDAETERLMKNVEQALGFYDSDYQTYLNAMEADREALAFEAENERWNKEFQNDNDHWEREFQNENSHWSQEFNTENAHWDKEFKQRQKEWNDRVAAGLHGAGDAYALAMLSLMQGEPVSDELLEAAGLDPEFAEQLRRYYANAQG